MYCVLKYIDYLTYKRYQHESVTTLRSLRSVDADPYNTKLYFNPNCLLQLILDYICTEVHINIDGNHYDLCTLNGDLLNIKDFKPSINGLTIFEPRQKYFIVVIKRNEEQNEMEEITPMLNPSSDIYNVLVTNISEKNLIKKKSSLIKRRSSTGSRLSLSHSTSSKMSAGSKGKRRSSANL